MKSLFFLLLCGSLPLLAEEEYHIVLDARERTKLSARVSGPIVKIYKKMGDPFTKGELLIQIDDSLFHAAVNKANAVYEKASSLLQSKEALYKDKSASLIELVDAKAQVATASSERAEALQALKESAIVGPYNGKVVTVYVHEHETPKVGDPLIEVIDDSILKAKFLMKSDQKAKVGDQIRIRLSETGENIKATIIRISPDIDPASGTIKVEAEIDNREGRLTSGMSGEVLLGETATDTSYHFKPGISTQND